MRRAAAAGGNPPPLIAVDQEGGLVKRLPWAPPSSAPAAMANPARRGRRHRPRAARAGITVDLAPVADVERRPNFLGSRAFGATEAEVAREACAFARGLQSAGVTPTLKHFPGLGRRRRQHRPRARHDPLAAAARALPPLRPPRARDALERDLPAAGPQPSRVRAGQPTAC